MNAEKRQRIQGHMDEINAELDAPSEVARNADGDSVEDMRAVFDKFGGKSIGDAANPSQKWWSTCDRFGEGSEAGFNWWANIGVDHLRITAKHANTFDPDCMDFEVWARAVIGRDMLCRECSGDEISYFDRVKIDQSGIWACGGGNGGYIWSSPFLKTSTWTAITRTQYAQQTAPAPTEAPTPARYVHNRDHGINTVIDRKDGDRAICICPHGHVDAYRIAEALNEVAK